MPPIRLTLLGSFALTVGEKEIADFPTGKVQALLAYLALESGRPHPREQLVGLFWPGMPQAFAFKNLRQSVYRLRQILDQAAPGVAAQMLRVTHQQIELNAARLTVDALQLQAAVAQSEHHAHVTLADCTDCLAQLDEAVACYHGELLAGLQLADAPGFEEWLLLRREQIYHRALLALSRLAAAYETRGDIEHACSYASRLLDLDPYREATLRQLMHLLARRGLVSQALAHYESFRQLLRTEISAEPDAETLALARQIQAGELASPARGQTVPATKSPAFLTRHSPNHDLDEMPVIEQFHGRGAEAATLERWLVADHCRLVMVQGMGGVGKTTLAAHTVMQVAEHFAVVLWRSLRNAPPLAGLLRSWLQILSHQTLSTLPDSLDEQLRLLVHYLRQERCLLVLDNVESVLLGEGQAGHLRPGYEGYGQLLQRIATAQHQSCLLLTGRERPQGLARLAQTTQAVRILPLAGLETEAAQALMAGLGLDVTQPQTQALITHYSGNPLALQVVATTITEFFAGSVDAFQQEGPVVFADIRIVLDEQMGRLSDLEMPILTWLAVLREAVTVGALREHLVQQPSQRTVLEAVGALQQRSLLVQQGEGFTLQNVVIEYLTERLVEGVCAELAQEAAAPASALPFLNRFALIKAQATEYIRQAQIRLILQPVIDRLGVKFGRVRLVEQVQRLLTALASDKAPGYAAGNLLNLLLHLGVDLTGYNLAGLSLWDVYLRGANLAGANLAGADLRRPVFTYAFRMVHAVAVSPDGSLMAAGDASGLIHLWQTGTWQPVGTLAGHDEGVWSLAFSPDSQLLASGSWDRTVRLWDVHHKSMRHILHGHTGACEGVAFSPDGKLLASGSWDRTVRLWAVADGQLHGILRGHGNRVQGVAFSPDGELLASGSWDWTVRLWAVASGQLLHTLQGHTDVVKPVAFSPDGKLLASGSWDRTVRLWAVADRRLLHTLTHDKAVASLAFHRDGTLLASAGDEQVVRVWDVRSGRAVRILSGHSSAVDDVAFYARPTGRDLLVSGSNDQTVRVWDVQTGQMLQTLQGHASPVFGMAISPDGALLASSGDSEAIRLWDMQTQRVVHLLAGHADSVTRALAFSPAPAARPLLASGGLDETVRVWDVAARTVRHVLVGHAGRVNAVAFSPGGELLASASNDRTVRVWDVATGSLLHVLEVHQSNVYALAFGPDGRLLAIGGDQHVLVWTVGQSAGGGQLVRKLSGHSDIILTVAFSPQPAAHPLLASGSWDQTVRLWDMATGRKVRRFTGHAARILCIAFSPDGQWLASGGDDKLIQLWQVQTGNRLQTLRGHQSSVEGVVFSPDGRRLVSCSGDETIRFWGIDPHALATSGPADPRQIWRAPDPYAGMNITGVTGITAAQKAALLALGAVER